MLVDGKAGRAARARIAAWCSRTTRRSTTARSRTTSRSASSAAASPANERRERAREWIAKVGLDVKRDAHKYPEPAVGRHAPARGDRAHADPVAAHHPDGRAVRRARSDDAAAHAGAAGRSVARSAGDGVLRHALDRGSGLPRRSRLRVLVGARHDPPRDDGAAAGPCRRRRCSASRRSSSACSRSATSSTTSRRRRGRATD